MNHEFIFVYCFGFYFGPICYIGFKWLIIFYSNILCLQFEFSYNICSFIQLSNLSLHWFSYSSFQRNYFFFPSTIAFLHRQHCQLLSSMLFYLFPYCPRVWPLVRISAYVVNSFSSLYIFIIYHPGDRRSPTIFNVVVENSGQRVVMLCRHFCVVRTFRCQMRRKWLIPRKTRRGAGVAADNEKATLNMNDGADPRALSSALLGGGNITD